MIPLVLPIRAIADSLRNLVKGPMAVLHFDVLRLCLQWQSVEDLCVTVLVSQLFKDAATEWLWKKGTVNWRFLAPLGSIVRLGDGYYVTVRFYYHHPNSVFMAHRS